MSRKLLILLFSVLIIPNLAICQSLRYGVAGGVNLSTLRIAQSPNRDELGAYKPGLSAGVFFEKKLLGKLEIFSEGLLSYKHTSKSYSSNNGQSTNYSEGIKAFLVELPVMLKVDNLFHFKRPIHLLGGASFGFAFNVEHVINFGAGSNNPYANVTQDVTNPLDFGLTGGFGVDLTNSISINARYTHGLSNFYRDAGWFKDGTIKSRFISVQLFYYLKP